MTDDEQRPPAASPDETVSPEGVARGRASGTPFVLLGGTALVIWAVVAIVAGLLLVVWWLV